MSLHAELSGSSAHRWIPCPGSIRLTRGMDRRSSPAARDGTKAHGLAECVLRYWLETGEAERGLRARWRAGTSFRWTDHGENCAGEVEQEMLDHVMVYVARVVQIVAQYGGREKAWVYLEMHVSLKDLVREGMFGTSDVVIDVPGDGILYVIDFKYGYWPVHLVVEGELNSQLMYYAAGALDKFKWRHKMVVLEVVQPRSQDVESVQSHGLHPDQVRAWADDVLYPAALATDATDAPLVPGEHCRFCDALSRCPAIEGEAMDVAVSDFAELAAPPAVPDNPRRLAKVLRWKPVLEAWLRECEAEALATMERGEDVPGFKLVAKRSNRKWPTEDPLKLYKMLKKAGVKMSRVDDIMAEPKLLSPAQLEKEFAKFKDEINEVAEKPDRGHSVAAESNVRGAADPASDFAELL